FEAAWPVAISPGGTLSTSNYYSSPQSIYIGTKRARNHRSMTPTYGTDSNPLVWSIQYYDNSAFNLDRQYVQLLDASPSVTQLLAMGTYNNKTAMRYYYSARIAYSPGPGWVILNDPGAPGRSIGWHEIKAVIKSTTIDFYVDDVLAKSNVPYSSYEGKHTFDQCRIGSGFSSTSAAYYDDFSVAGGQ
ncbi:MAG: hypothetical protein JSV03_09795, partial [Planctomycetota bacterium]